MNYNIAWDSMGKVFYSVTFALLISAVLAWDNAFLKWIYELKTGNIVNILPGLIVFLLILYFIIDWLDATIASTIDKVTEIYEIFFWLFATVSMAAVIILTIKKAQFSILWLYTNLAIYLFISTLVLILRNRFVDVSLAEFLWQKGDKKGYDSTNKTFMYQNIIIFLNVTVLILTILVLSNMIKFAYSNKWGYSIFVFAALINTIIKFLRHKNILIPLYQHKIQGNRSNQFSPIQIKL